MPDRFWNFGVTLAMAVFAMLGAAMAALFAIGLTALPISLAYLLYKWACVIH